MIRPGHSVYFAVAAFCSPSAALAQMPAGEARPACTSPGSLPAPLAGWANLHMPVIAASRIVNTDKATLNLGNAVDATLRHTPEVHYAVQPAKPGGSVSYGGMFAFTVTVAGTYRVALNAHSWTDVIEDGAAIASIAHGHGPECTGVAKMVDYPLKPGKHLLQISANGDPGISIMVARLP